MNKCKKIPLILVIMLPFYVCNIFESTDNSYVKIQSDRNTYEFDQSMDVSIEVINKMNHSIYYICTCQIYLEEIVDGLVEQIWQVHGFEECAATIEIKENENVVFDLYDLEWLIEDDRFNDAIFDESVAYRFRLNLFDEKNSQSYDFTNPGMISNKVKILR